MWYILGFGYFLYNWLVEPCPGPLVEYPVPMSVEDLDDGAQVVHVGSIQRCSTCPYIVTTGNYHDIRHIKTPLVEESDE